MSGSVVVAGARTPIGKLAGVLGTLSAMELGGIAIASALERAGVSPDRVDSIVMGQVVQAGQGQDPARQAAVHAGIPLATPATTINKVCLSGLQALYLADLMIGAGDAEIVVAGGMESMTQIPYILPGARGGFRLDSTTLYDGMMLDGLSCAFDQCSMGTATERFNRSAGISREQQDAFAAGSHEKAAAAAKDGRLAEEIVAVSVPQRRGDPVMIDADEGIRPGTTTESLATLRPAFDPEGTITAGTSSQISDGAAALVVTSRAKAEELGMEPLGELVGYGQVAGPDLSLLLQPARAIAKALSRSGMTLADVDLFEINEAFAAVVLASQDEMGIPDDVLNVNGGAIALGHPIGMSGARIALSALLELRRRGGGLAAVGLCGGGGQGDAALLRSPA